MKQECILVQGKCNKIVTSAMPPFHHSKNKNSKKSICFLINSCSTNYVTLSVIITSHCLSTHTQKSK